HGEQRRTFSLLYRSLLVGKICLASAFGEKGLLLFQSMTVVLKVRRHAHTEKLLGTRANPAK
ncbi:hypothetical protein RA263_28425, partial [Pseudomonas syringae pv. tagetis]|uniref:hypothetical protein n=1 Tax=Pseudomonas syringae group genomosp. 7 TaxID=251699 RepID=UPI0037704DA8